MIMEGLKVFEGRTYLDVLRSNMSRVFTSNLRQIHISGTCLEASRADKHKLDSQIIFNFHAYAVRVPRRVYIYTAKEIRKSSCVFPRPKPVPDLHSILSL
jgi:hypothetical protein